MLTSSNSMTLAKIRRESFRACDTLIPEQPRTMQLANDCVFRLAKTSLSIAVVCSVSAEVGLTIRKLSSPVTSNG